MSEHTPGPWKWNEERPATYDLEWLQGSNGYRILTIYGNGKETADKLLIAAAPDLLEACERLENALVFALRGHPVRNADEIISQAQAAIAKATRE
jgi:hypothetical protein